MPGLNLRSEIVEEVNCHSQEIVEVKHSEAAISCHSETISEVKRNSQTITGLKQYNERTTIITTIFETSGGNNYKDSTKISF